MDKTLKLKIKALNAKTLLTHIETSFPSYSLKKYSQDLETGLFNVSLELKREDKTPRLFKGASNINIVQLKPNYAHGVRRPAKPKKQVIFNPCFVLRKAA